MRKIQAASKKNGKVYLIGAGPGDAGLMTLKGKGCLERADVVIYDYLANKSFLDWVPGKSEKIYVGKKGASHSQEQEEIERLLIDRARRGKTVVRLKGGDPFVFGRGGEEAEALAAAGVPFEIVPGVTSAISVPAYAGIPVTHRDYASAFTVITGHVKDEDGSQFPDWQTLSQMGTLVFLMAYANLAHITEKLMNAGLDPETPAAVVEWGTYPQQKKVVSTLKNLVGDVKRKSIRPPTITVIGKVVDLSEKLAWFEKRPFFGKRIVVTRSREQASDLARGLEELGAEVILCPTIRIEPPASWENVDRAIKTIKKYSWIVFSSVNGVNHFMKRLSSRGLDARALAHAKVAVVGQSSAESLESFGVRADVVAKSMNAEGLLKQLKKEKWKGKKVLFPRARDGRDVLNEGLEKLGAKVDVVEAYRSVLLKDTKSLPWEKVDLMTFASSRTVENFVRLMKKGGNGGLALPVVSIGPTTTATLKKEGFQNVLEASQPSIPGLIQAIRTFFKA